VEGGSPWGGRTRGEVLAGIVTVGEVSLSSLRLKLFLFSDSAPDRERGHIPDTFINAGSLQLFPYG